MKKTFIKTIFREFKQSFGRFIAIIAIIALTNSFVVGLLSSPTALQNNMNVQYQTSNMYDTHLRSTKGIFESDIDFLESQSNIEHVFAFNSLDALVSYSEGTNVSARIVALEFDKMNEPSFINRLTLISGRMPQNNTECVVERESFNFESPPLGNKITIDYVDESLENIVVKKELNVVGVVGNSLYFDKKFSESTTVGSKTLECVIYTTDDFLNFPLVAMYSDTYIIFNGTRDQMRFSDSYCDYVKDNSKILTTALAKNDTDNPNLNDRAWFAIDLSMNPSFANYYGNTKKIENIAFIFPFFFLFVAALVALTTMTRMVEEDRVNTGTLKALGYSKAAIASKYLIYCFVATLIGVGLGLGFCFIIPKLVHVAFVSLFHIPPLSSFFNVTFALVAAGVSFLLTLSVTLFSSVRILKERAATLMRPQAPKKGKRIFLENFGFAWKRLSFKYKATIRNIFRHKKQLFLTVIGVAGCTALLLTGFGINDSISGIVSTQYNKIVKYDIVLQYNSLNEKDELDSFLNQEYKDNHIFLYNEYTLVQSSKDQLYTPFYIANSDSNLAKFMAFNTRQKNVPIDFNSESCILNEKMADALGVKLGDNISINTDNGEFEFAVTAIAENYLNSFVYISQSLYTKVSNVTPINNTAFLVNTNMENTANIREQLSSLKSVTGITLVEDLADNYSNLLDSLKSIVAIIVVTAGALCVVVLYNLTNINIRERKKELSTLKVLGYHSSEVAMYIFRESFIMTLFGILLGLCLGFLLHLYLVVQLDTYNMMMGRDIKPLSFIFAFLFTIFFTIATNLCMIPTIRKIKMTDSMKANE